MSHLVTPVDVRPTAGLLKALSDENRLRIVALLSRGELCVCHIAAALELTQPNVSQHLAVLKNAGLVEAERRGSWIYHRLAAAGDPARDRILAAVLDTCRDLASAAADRRRLAATRVVVGCE